MSIKISKKTPPPWLAASVSTPSTSNQRGLVIWTWDLEYVVCAWILLRALPLSLLATTSTIQIKCPDNCCQQSPSWTLEGRRSLASPPPVGNPTKKGFFLLHCIGSLSLPLTGSTPSPLSPPVLLYDLILFCEVLPWGDWLENLH